MQKFQLKMKLKRRWLPPQRSMFRQNQFQSQFQHQSQKLLEPLRS